MEILEGDCRELLRGMPAGSVRCCVTSPPYWGLRDYGHEGQLGLERTPGEYVERMVEVFREVRRVLADDGTLWLNLGDSYWSDTLSRKDPVESMWGNRPASDLTHGRDAIPLGNRRGGLGERPPGLKPKDLVGIPWRVAFALQADGWWLRSDIIWAKPNPMPESVTDRPTKAHEYLFLLSKSERYYYDAAAIAEPFQTDPRENYPARARITGRGGLESSRAPLGAPRRDQSGGLPPNGDGRNRRSVWTIATQPFPGAHFAVMPEALVEPCILAGSAPGDLVLDPFAGAGTVGVVALRHGRRFVGVELNPEYVRLARKRIAGPLFAAEGAPGAVV